MPAGWTAPPAVSSKKRGSAAPSFTAPGTASVSTFTSCRSSRPAMRRCCRPAWSTVSSLGRSEEHTSELQSLTNLVCRLLLEKKKKNKKNTTHLKTVELIQSYIELL